MHDMPVVLHKILCLLNKGFFWLFVNCSGLKSAKLEKGQ
ncbi:hypothetical protein ERS070169_02159, partial [Streptococcus pneumoniae]